MDKKELDQIDKNVAESMSVASEREKSKEIMADWDRARNFNNTRQDAYAELMAFYQGNQHLLKNYKTKQPWVVNMNTPYASVAIDNRVSSLLSQDYIGELLPLSEEDVIPIEKLSKVYRKIWEQLNLDQRVRDSIRNGSIVREYYVHIIAKNEVTGVGKNKRLGNLEAYCIEPGAVFIDPAARKLKNAGFMFVSDRISREEASRQYPKIKDLVSTEGDIFTPEDRGEVYIENDYDTNQDNVLTMLTYYKKIKTEQGKNKIYRAILINGIIVGEKELSLTNFPILQFRWKKAAQSCYGLSLMDDVLSLQKAITAIESAITNTAVAYAAPSMLVSKGSGIDPKVAAKAIGAPGVVYAANGDLSNAMKPVVPPKVEDSILKIKVDYEQKIDKITGNSSQFLGNIGTAGNTSSGAKMAVERAKIIEVDVLNNIAEFVEDITNVLIEYIIALYGGEKVTALNGKKPDGTYDFMEVELPTDEELSEMRYKYYIELDTKTPYSKERQKELLLEIYQLERQYDTPIKSVTISDIIKHTDLENRDEIIARFNQLTMQDANTKAETIQKFIATSTDIGVDPGLLTQAISEIIASYKETPAVDEIMKIMEDNFRAQMAQAEQKMGGAVDQLMNTPESLSQINAMVAGGQPQGSPTNLNELAGAM